MIMHICCAPCGGGCVERLISEGITPVLYYSNSNLNSPDEFELRLEMVKKLAVLYSLELAVDPYDHDAWLRHTAGLEKEPERGRRCGKCFDFSLNRTAIFAQGRPFCTTLTVSPMKSSAAIFETGSKWENFVCCDFKKKDGYRRSCQIAREQGFYRQKYCGCEYSLNNTGGGHEGNLSG